MSTSDAYCKKTNGPVKIRLTRTKRRDRRVGRVLVLTRSSSVAGRNMRLNLKSIAFSTNDKLAGRDKSYRWRQVTGNSGYSVNERSRNSVFVHSAKPFANMYLPCYAQPGRPERVNFALTFPSKTESPWESALSVTTRTCTQLRHTRSDQRRSIPWESRQNSVPRDLLSRDLLARD